MLSSVSYCIDSHAWSILTRFTKFLSNFRRKMKTSKDKYQKKIDRNVECENIGYRNSERIYDEWGWGHTNIFFFDIFCIWHFGFLCFFTFDSYFWYISFPHNLNKSKSFKFNFFRDFWHDLYDLVAPCTLKR